MHDWAIIGSETVTIMSRLDRIPEGDGRTDRQTDGPTDGQNCYINIARQCADAR